MGKIKCFEIIFDDNKTVYNPGERVSGKCIVELKGDMRMRALRVFMRGVAKVHWTESRSTGTRLGSYTEHYNAEVEYFFKRQVLFGGGEYFHSFYIFSVGQNINIQTWISQFNGVKYNRNGIPKQEHISLVVVDQFTPVRVPVHAHP